MSVAKNLPLGLIAIVSLVQSAPTPEDARFVGTWQGVAKEGSRQLRFVFKLSIENDKLSAVNYRIDESGDALPVVLSRNSSGVKMTIPAVSATFEGKLSADGNTLAGTFTRLERVPLRLTRATETTAWTIPDEPDSTPMMPADARPRFEVATIKPSRSEEVFAIRQYTGKLEATAASVGDLIRFAFSLHPRQIAAGPGWIETEKYDVTGKPDVPGMPSLLQSKAMVQKLLEDRFQLTFRWEKKEMSVYAINVARREPNLTRSGYGGALPSFRTAASRIAATNTTIAEFAQILQTSFVDQPVVDQTGLGGTRYSFNLKWTPDNAQPGTPRDPDLPDLFSAFQQQLGLRLQSTKTLTNVMVIDHIAKPSPN